MESEDQELSNVSEEDFANLDSSSESSRYDSVQSSEDESDPSTRADSKTKPKKQKKQQVKKTKKMSKPKIIFNVSDTQYDVVKYVGKKLFKWKLTYDKESMDWDIMWTDNAVLPETLAKMQTFQKINHFPGMYSLARKNHLGRNLMRMKKAFPEQYKFFPQTFLLPSEYNDFRMQFNKKKAKTFIVKPEASCQGRGIFLTRTFESVQPGEHYVAQRYLHKPYLIDGLKFDMRIYVLLAGCDPLKIYLYDDGLGRFATEEYVAPTGENLDNVCMHLTNYAINKDNPNFVFNESSSADDVGHKRSLKAVFKTLKEEGHDVDLLWKEIKKIIIKTFCSVQPILAHSYKSCHPDEPYNNMCFELLGFDVMLDHKLKPWLIEVNHTPSFTTDTPLDKHIKKSAIRDALRLMNISVENRTKAKNKKRAELQQRVLTGKKIKITPEEKQAAFEKAQRERNTWEAKNQGRYTKIYPLDDPAEADEDYEDFMRVANKWWEEWTGTSVKRVIKKPVEPNKPPPMVFGQGPGPGPGPSNMSTRAKDIQSIYSQKLKAGPKPGSVQSQRPTQGYSSPNNKPSTATQNFRSPNKGQWNENNENLEVPMVDTRELDEENKDFMNHLAAISEVEGIDVLAEDYEEDWDRINDPRRSLQAQPQSQAIPNKMRTTINSQEKWIRKDMPMKETGGSLLLTNDARLVPKYENRAPGTKGPSFRIKSVNAPKDSPQKAAAERSQTDDQKFHFSKKFAHYIPSETLEDPNAPVSTQGDAERGLDGRTGKEKETNVRKTPLKMANGIVGTIGMVSEAHWNQAGSTMSVDMDAETRNMSAAGISRNGDLRSSVKKPTLTAYQPMKLPKNNMAPKLYEMTVSIKEDGPVRSTVSNSFGLSLQGLGVGNKGTGFAPNQSNQKVAEINLNYFHDSQITMQRYYNFYTRGKK